jgi:hypothetical protein
VLAKTAQKHDYPSASWRRSYARRSGAERGFSTVKDPAASDIARGWCRLMGLTPLMLFTAVLLVARNQRVLAAWEARQEENTRRAAKGLPPKTRRRRRKTLTALTAAAPPLPWPAKPPCTHATSTNATTTTARARPDTKTQARNSKKGRLRRPLPTRHEQDHRPA